MTKLIVTSRNFAKAPKMGSVNRTFAHSRLVIIQKPDQRWRAMEGETDS
jgi:hypothetical protein